MGKRIVIAESSQLFLEAISASLSFLGFDVAGATSTASEVPRLVRENRPDVLLFDVNLAADGLAGLPDIAALKVRHPDLKILVLGFQDLTDELAVRLSKSGFDGFWSKYGDGAGFIRALNLLFP